MNKNISTSYRQVMVAALIALTAALLAAPAQASTVYADWLTVSQIQYWAPQGVYLVIFNGTVSTAELDDFGNPCDKYDAAVIIANSNGVTTTQEHVDAMARELQIARALGLRVRLWVHRCTGATNTTTRPKAYGVQTRP